MPFTARDFQDLLLELDAHPEWRAELRRRLLSDELLDLPILVRRLEAAQEGTALQLTILVQRLDGLVMAQEETAHQLTALTLRVDALAQRVDALTERMDALTVRMDALTERMDALTVRMDALTERMDALTVRMDALTVRMDALTERMDALTAAQEETARQLSALTARVDALVQVQERHTQQLDHHTAQLDHHTDQLAELQGHALEARYARLAGAYFSPLARRLRVIDHARLADDLDDGVDRGVLSDRDRMHVLATDLVLRGVRRSDGSEILLLVEISVGIGLHDVERAADRSAVLARLGRPVVAIVAGGRIDPAAASLAEDRGVIAIVDGRSPDYPAQEAS